MIRTETTQHYSGESSYVYSFNVPAFSEVKKIYLSGNYLYMVIRYPEEYNVDASKLINLKVQSDTIPKEDLIYKYFDTQIITKTELINNTYGSGNNIQFSANTISTPHHFLINEIKPLIEERDSKIKNIIND